ncbi:hypothetical protein C7B82_05630 [Stenomitos frigidus ULC18]|uniref:Uncharacterized protein n=1 Tax=Stenomitos frigidus ULC18 TaxID=2107698 RepID=A0A2T1EI79_9CYAN|nr:hypothetical protein C7B82_05630 [Stenomitos frigidus ULC18]
MKSQRLNALSCYVWLKFVLTLFIDRNPKNFAQIPSNVFGNITSVNLLRLRQATVLLSTAQTL